MYLPRFARVGVLRHPLLRDALTRPTRVSAVQNQLCRLSLSAKPRPAILPIAARSPLASQRACLATEAATEEKKPRAKRGPKSKSEQSKSKAKPPKKKKEESATQKLKKQRAHIRQLKETALQSPKLLPSRWIMIAVQANMPDKAMQRGEAMKIAHRKIESLGSDEIEKFKIQAQENEVANKASYDAWIQTHTPLQIRRANDARAALNRLGKKPNKPLKDARLPRRPYTSYTCFFRERSESGDLKHMSLVEFSKQVSSEWKSLNEAEKEPYVKQHTEDVQRYQREHLDVFGEITNSERRLAARGHGQSG
ncbi:hypothetical protein N7492_010249 [Penicillium capsulatum]|uniref:HMG box domain-containing protein n=1 Tax=Penicillium capsulatum TaxID=69766 RepID=A0A9W9HN27_9EURO|nr:hypothetical protein N7492_010249 [Penicillium capsulatum]KAJ6112756.1 hypothetical protein N7512_008080 [Penicillium capsulatum]